MKKTKICSILLILVVFFTTFIVYQPAYVHCNREKTSIITLTREFYLINSENDTDEDGMPNEWEILYDLDPDYDDSRLDMDWDLLTNLEEYTYNTDPWNPDTDGDGFGDGYEVEKGTDPADPKDHPVRVWLIILIVVLSVGIIAFAAWAVYITKKDAREKSKEKN
ncbi:MAG: hypothetical protein ACTSO7_03935 [Candidatus Heimdallarchaeota archaeon]